MLIKEFIIANEFDVSDAVIFHDRLNEKLWAEDGTLLPEVRNGLLTIAKNFIEFIGVKFSVVDITISGSNAAYSYTEHSDIDLHVVAKVPKKNEFTELFDAKKNQYNTEHDIKVRDIDVELYVQPADQLHVSQGIYSVLKDQWVSKPKKEQVNIDSDDVRKKYKNYRDEIRTVLQSQDINVVKEIWNDIKRMRKAGLEKAGEYGTENITFKLLRNQGWIEKLKDHINNLVDKELSIEDFEYEN